MKLDPSLELDRVKIKYERGDNTLKILCPFHTDTNPSCDIFIDTGRFKCYGCSVSGPLSSLLAKITGRPQYAIQTELETRYGIEERAVDPEVIERFHSALWSDKYLVNELHNRAVNDNAIRKYRLGADKGRVTIPITDPSGQWVNVRRYSPGETDGPKMTNMRGRGKKFKLFPFSQLHYQNIIICGGEVKAIAAASALNEPFKIGAVTLSGGGEADWIVAYEAFFEGKHIWVCMDVDQPGRKAAEYKCTRLSTIAEWVGNVVLPFDQPARFPKGGIDDFIAEHGVQRLVSVLESTPRYEPSRGYIPEENNPDPVSIAVEAVASPDYVNRRVRCDVVVSAIDQSIYYVPRRVKIICDKDQECCGNCPVFLAKHDEFEISPESTAILAIMESKKAALREEILDGVHIPRACGVAEYEILKNYKVVETRVQKSMDLSEQCSDKLMLPAVVVDSTVDLNETYEIVGQPVPHPKTQAATLIVSQTQAIADALSTFDAGDTRDLEIFRPDDWTPESIEEMLSRIYEYYSRSVTRIYDRPSLHKFVDLVFHSVLSINIDGANIKGWLELLVVGDSSQGKSETLLRMMEYIGLGVKIDCKNASVAGLHGGLEQIGGKWFAQWGIIPVHDRRLVVLEELKGTRPEVFSKLTDMRSSGYAEITKIQHRRAQARTRLIALSNAAGIKTMSEYAFGIQAVPELVINPEDVRRFDAAIILNREDLNPAALHERRGRIDSWFTKESARRLILWAWTRKKDEVFVNDDTWGLCLTRATELCDMFSENIPLIDRGSTKHKLLRFATALACRTFSSDSTGRIAIVRPCHVDYVFEMLKNEYSSISNGYLDYSKHDARRRGALDKVALREELERLPYAKLMVERMLVANEMDAQDFRDWCSWSIDEANTFLSAMVRCNALQRSDDKILRYRKTPGAIEEFKQALSSGTLGASVPSHIEKDTYK